MNLLRKGLTDYLELRRGLGFKLVIDERHLRAFIAFLECRKTSHITTRLALEFATFRKNLDPRSWVQRLCAVRAFALYGRASTPRLRCLPRVYCVTRRSERVLVFVRKPRSYGCWSLLAACHPRRCMVCGHGLFIPYSACCP